MLTRPAQFFATAAVREQKGLGRPLLFTVVMLLGGDAFVAISLFHRFGVGAQGSEVDVRQGIFGWMLDLLVVSAVLAVVGVFIGGAVIHVIGRVAGAEGTYEQSVRIACYATAVLPVAAVLSFIPVLPTEAVAYVYGIYIVARGLIAVEAANPRTTFITCGVLALILPLVAFILFIAALFISGGTLM